MTNLWVVMPVFNEQAVIGDVISEWLGALREVVGEDFKLCVVNDGSSDATLAILQKLATDSPELAILDKANTGHGQSCLVGYRKALGEGAMWVLQVDSDGQCDPRFFSKFWELRTVCGAVYGFRKTRADGFTRGLISRFVSVFALLATGTWVRDANVPYRLMRAPQLNDLVLQIPEDFYLSNVLLAILHERQCRIKWVDIHFRQRQGGIPSVKGVSFLRHGLKLFLQLREFSRGKGRARVDDSP